MPQTIDLELDEDDVKSLKNCLKLLNHQRVIKSGLTEKDYKLIQNLRISLKDMKTLKIMAWD